MEGAYLTAQRPSARGGNARLLAFLRDDAVYRRRMTSMSCSRRKFVASSSLAVAGLAAGSGLIQAATKASGNRVQLGISSYSYWHFKTDKVPIEKVIDNTAALGVAGVDVLHREMDLPEKDPLTAAHRSYVRQLKRHALTRGVSLICLSIHQNFVSPDAE